MGFSVVKLVLSLLIAFVLGVSMGWWLRSRKEPGRSSAGDWQGDSTTPVRSHGAASSGTAAASGSLGDAPAPTPAPEPDPMPAPSSSPPTADDLKRIRGVGAVLERKLHGLGVTRFSQIAAWTDADVARVDDQLQFRGRIERDDWIGQAKALM